MTRLIASLLLLLAASGSALAAGSATLGVYSGAGGVPYVGPLDAVSGASVCFSLRACTAAYAAPGAAPSVQVRRASDSTLKDIPLLSNGNLNSASALSFGGLDATATCSTSGSSTTLSCTGASAQPATAGGDEIVGTGITGPAYTTACGTFTAGTGTCTMNVARTVASTTVTFNVGLFVRKWYDQTLGNKCAAVSCDMLTGTNANQALLLLNCLNSGTLPCIAAPPSGAPTITSAGNFTPATGIVTIVVVGERAASSGAQIFMRENGVGNRLSSAAGANSWTLTGGSSGSVSATVSDNAAHAIVGNITNAATSCIYVDNTPTPAGCTGTTVTGNTTASTVSTLSATTATYMGEIWFYDNVTLSSGQVSTLHTNQAAYWGTP